MTDFKHIEEQIAELHSRAKHVKTECWCSEYLSDAADTMQAILDVVRAVKHHRYYTKRIQEGAGPGSHLGMDQTGEDIDVALDKLKAEKVIDAADRGRDDE